ncbi:MAG: UDP-3-O-acylglucosamine N-acyltransferase [Candidatus Poribacteria bacterium]|nr:MAG: UDP-3-O-acylglucosamine N-acyltransferase [Candidatus Poribacteria bacterium]
MWSSLHGTESARTLAELAELLNAELHGDGSIQIYGVSGIREAQPGHITFLANRKYLSELPKTRASAVIIGKDIDPERIPAHLAALRVENPYLSFVDALELFSFRKRRVQIGIAETAVIGHNVQIGENVSIQAHAVIGDNVVIGDRTVIGPLVYIGDDTRIGSDCLIYPNVTIREEVTIGDRVIIHSGAVIGSDGFGFAKVSNGHRKIPQIGTVIIGDDVEIGANTCVDRATMTNGATIIGRGTKIDNLVQVAHNVQIGENALIVALVGIAGSTIIEDNVTLAGQVGTAGHLRIGRNSVILAKSGVTKDVPPDSYYSGFPAIDHKEDLRQQALQRRLPELYEQVRELRRKLAELEEAIQRAEE